MVARWMPNNFTSFARRLKRSTSVFCWPNNLTSKAPPMLRVSFMVAFIRAFISIWRLAISRNTRPRRLAAKMNSGRMKMPIKVSRHSRVNITTRTDITSMKFVTRVTRVRLMAVCANYIIIQSADQFTQLGMCIKPKGHTLQVFVQRDSQIINNPFTDLRG